MIYLEFLLFFFAIMLIYDITWVIIRKLIILNIAKLFKTIQALKIHMIIERLIYCLIILQLAILTIHEFHLKDESIFFRFYMIIISLIYFIFYFADIRNNQLEKTKSNKVFQSNYYDWMPIFLAIEWISIALFIPLVFFPQIFDNYISLKIYEFFSYIASIKILGTILGVIGIIVLIKYIFTIVLTIIAKFSKNKDDDVPTKKETILFFEKYINKIVNTDNTLVICFNLSSDFVNININENECIMYFPLITDRMILKKNNVFSFVNKFKQLYKISILENDTNLTIKVPLEDVNILKGMLIYVFKLNESSIVEYEIN